MPNYPAKDYDDTTRRPIEWWETIEGEGPKPYSTAAWTYFQAVVELEEPDQSDG